MKVTNLAFSNINDRETTENNEFAKMLSSYENLNTMDLLSKLDDNCRNIESPRSEQGQELISNFCENNLPEDTCTSNLKYYITTYCENMNNINNKLHDADITSKLVGVSGFLIAELMMD
jgi:hypothetical protein